MVVDVCHWYVLAGKGSISFPFPCVRGWKRFHTRTRQSRVRSHVRRSTNPAPACQPGRLRCKTPTEQGGSTNKQNVPITSCSCFLCASLCCFSHFIPRFPTFSAAFLSLSLLFPVSGFAHALKSLLHSCLCHVFPRGTGAPSTCHAVSAAGGGRCRR